jgi:hypothetical protein
MLIPYDTEKGGSGTRAWGERRDLPPEEPPPSSYLRAVCEARRSSRAVRRALWRERRISDHTADEFGIGWDADRGAWVLSAWEEWGSLVNVTWRPPRGKSMRWKGNDVDHPMRLAGRRAEDGHLPLWPHVPEGRTWLLTAGEWDALVAIQAGLPGVTGLLGCKWNAAWDRFVIGRRIAVVYDVGEELAAARTVERLRAAGAAEAWVVDLRSVGLDYEGADVCDHFLRGGTSHELCRATRRARHA